MNKEIRGYEKTRENKYRDCFGNLCYTLEREKDGNKYSIVNHKDKSRPFEILQLNLWSNNDAYMTDDNMIMFDRTPKFDSFIQAVAWLKKNIWKLL